MGEYLVIKLNGDWIKRGKNKNFIEMYLKGTHFAEDIKFVEPPSLRITKSVPKEWEQAFGAEVIEHTKKEIAISLTELLLQDGFIRFKAEEQDYRISVEGSLVVIPTPKERGEE